MCVLFFNRLIWYEKFIEIMDSQFSGRPSLGWYGIVTRAYRSSFIKSMVSTKYVTIACPLLVLIVLIELSTNR